MDESYLQVRSEHFELGPRADLALELLFGQLQRLLAEYDSRNPQSVHGVARLPLLAQRFFDSQQG